MKINSFFSKSVNSYCPLVLGDVVRILDSDDKMPLTYFVNDASWSDCYFSVSIPEMIARFIDKSVQALLKMKELSKMSDIEKLKYYPAITNYMCGILDVLVYLKFIEDNKAAEIMKYLNGDFMRYLLDKRYYSYYTDCRIELFE